MKTHLPVLLVAFLLIFSVPRLWLICQSQSASGADETGAATEFRQNLKTVLKQAISRLEAQKKVAINVRENEIRQLVADGVDEFGNKQKVSRPAGDRFLENLIGQRERKRNELEEERRSYEETIHVLKRLLEAL